MLKLINNKCFFKLAFLAIFCLTFYVQTNAQTTIIKGKVYDASTNEPLPFVNISFLNSKIGTTSNFEGEYSIETYYPTDSLLASFVGYKTFKTKIKKDQVQEIDIYLEPSSVALKEVIITYKGNPADEILERIIQNKEANNRKKYDYYEYEVYNKLEFDINNIGDELKNKRIFKKIDFIFDNVDTTSEKDYLPVMLVESLSDYYYRREPRDKKETVKATKVSGISNESIAQFTGDMYQNVNVYDNYIEVFGKAFVSPVSDFGKRFYKYYLIDSAMVDGSFCYKLEFKAKHKQEPTFYGEMWVNDTTYAIKSIEAGISEGVNINFIHGFWVKQEFKKIDGKYWMLSKDQLVVDFNITKKTMGMYGRKTTTYKNIKVNFPRDDEYYSGVEDVVVDENANQKDEEFWEKHRHDTLQTNEKEIYQMVDSLKQVPIFRTFVDLVKMAATGYYEWGNFEIGPYYTFYSYNDVEGHRFRFGGRTSNNFSKTIEFSGHGAYGVKDEEYKYGVGTRIKISRKPRRLLSVSHKKDVEQLGRSTNAFSEDNILSSFLRRSSNNKLTMVEEYKSGIENDWFQGLTSKLIAQKRIMSPLGVLNYQKLNQLNDTIALSNIKTSEVSFYTRFAFREKFIAGEFDRVSLGSKYPTIEGQLTLGIKGALESKYEYQKLEIILKDKIILGTIGYTYWRLEGGKIWGTLPYPLLVLHQGNETYFYDYLSFNLMNYFEFASDEYASVSVYHHFDGYFFNKMPLFRKLKWREVITGRAVIGNLDAKHNQAMLIPNTTFSLNKPYIELSAGIENILKVFRVDALWRLTHLDKPNVANYGIRGSLSINF